MSKSAYTRQWSLKEFFPSLTSSEYQNFVTALDREKKDLLARMAKLPALTAKSYAEWSKFLRDYESFEGRSNHVMTYVYALMSVDTSIEEYPKEMARLTQWGADAEQLKFRLEIALRESTDADFEGFLQSPEVAGLQYFLRQTRNLARERMESELENFNAEMAVNGEIAWAQMYQTIMGKLKFEQKVPGAKPETLSFSQKASLLGSSDAAVRQAALHGSNAAIKAYEDVLSSTLNALAGGRHTLWQRRGQKSFLSMPMSHSGVEESTIEAMYAAIRDQLPRLRRHLKVKAQVLGLPKLGFQDLGAPLPKSKSATSELSWDDGVNHVLRAFGIYPKLQKYTRHMVESAWIDSEPSDRRAPGGYCTGSDFIREQRIFMTYKGSFGDVQTLAHEVGHAFHAYLLNDARPFGARYPMTLAETASTFAQTLFVKDALSSPQISADIKAQILTETTNDVISFSLDIMMRYEFEKRFYQKRRQGTLSAKDLCDLMTEVQKEIFGDALDESQLDPYFWASKMHFFFSGLSFYNFPYTFGYLLSRYLVGRRLREGSSFDATYEEFLLKSGADSCEGLCLSVLGEDIHQKDFWARALQDCGKDLDLFESQLA